MWQNSIIYVLEYVFIIWKIKNVKTTHDLIIHHQKHLDSMMDISIAYIIFKHAPQILQLGVGEWGGGGGVLTLRLYVFYVSF